MQPCTTELYITSICHQIIIHECYLNDRVLMNINICFSPIYIYVCVCTWPQQFNQVIFSIFSLLTLQLLMLHSYMELDFDHKSLLLP